MLAYQYSDISRELIDRVHAGRDKTPYLLMTPSVFETGKMQSVRIESRHDSMEIQGRFLVMVSPYYEFDYTAFDWHVDDIFEAEAEGGVLEFNYYFPEEQLYRVIVAEKNEAGPRLFLSSCVYALEADLCARKPLIGDLHCHTIFSDGFEAPELVLESAVRCGFDFIAITDHNDFRAAALADRILAEKKLPITFIRGEEYSSSFTGMHIISLGAGQALSEEIYRPENPADGAVKSTEQYIRELVGAIHANGGVSVMCHPMWKPLARYIRRMDVPHTLVKKLLSEGLFDAVEVVSGSPEGELMTSLEQYQIAVDAGATPDRIAYLGSTDSHNYSIDPICGRHFTMVFARDNSERDILESIREKQCVAVQLVDRSNALCFGPLRLVRYAKFLLKEKYGLIS